MKTFFKTAWMPAVLLIAAPSCEPSHSPPALVTTSPSQQSNGVTPKLAERKIFGAFGWKLGQGIPSSYQITQGSDGSSFYAFESTNFPPFNNFMLYLLNDGRIYSITADVASESPRERDHILSELTDKYGAAAASFYDRWETETISDGYAEINERLMFSTDSLSINYEDKALAKQNREEQKARDDSRQKPHLKGL